MNATEQGAKQGTIVRRFDPAFFESLTKQSYRLLGEARSQQVYRTEAKQKEFVQGWMAVNQRFFQFLADGPRRRVSRISFTVKCMRCGAEEHIDVIGRDLGSLPASYREKPCPLCQKEARYILDEFELEREKGKRD